MYYSSYDCLYDFNFCWFAHLQAQFDAGELITQRETVSLKVSEELTERAGQFGLVLDDISLVCFIFTFHSLSLSLSSTGMTHCH